MTYPEDQARDKDGQPILLDSGGVTVTDTTFRGGKGQFYMSEYIGELTLSDGRKLGFDRNPFGRPQFIIRFPDTDPKHPGASVMIDLQAALMAAVAAADAKLPEGPVR